MPLALPVALEPYRTTIESAAQPAVRLEPPGDSAGAAAQYGGRPLVPPGAAWPQGANGPMRFVGHVDFARVRRQAGAAAAALPDDGVLAFFGEPHRWPGDSRHGDGWTLLYTPRSVDAVRLDVPAPPASPRRPFPLSLFSRSAPVLSGPELLLGATPVTSLPSHDQTDGLIEFPQEADALWDAYFEELLPPEGGGWHQLLGYATWIQWDRRAVVEALARGERADAAYKGPRAPALRAAAGRWRLLWQVDSDERAGLRWGDAGQLYVLITDEDLRARRFEHAFLTGDCY